MQWGHGVRAVVPVGEAKHKLEFDNGETSQEYDLVVGADGAWSKVRPLLTDVRPSYSGITGIELCLSDIDKRYPALSQFAGNGSLCALADNKAIMSQRNGDASVRVYLQVRRPESWLSECGIPFDRPEEARKHLLDIFADWHSNLTDFISQCDDLIVPRALYHLPVGHEWKHRPGVTLVGDAAHLMTPFSGEGVNLAMKDAVDLATAIASSAADDDLNAAVIKYEQAMYARSKEAAQETARNLGLFFADDALQRMVEIFKHLHGLQAAQQQEHK